METPSVALEDYFSLLYYRKKNFIFFYTHQNTTFIKANPNSHGRLNLTNKNILNLEN